MSSVTAPGEMAVTRAFSRMTTPRRFKTADIRRRMEGGNADMNLPPAMIVMPGSGPPLVRASCQTLPATSAEEGPPPTMTTFGAWRLK